MSLENDQTLQAISYDAFVYQQWLYAFQISHSNISLCSPMITVWSKVSSSKQFKQFFFFFHSCHFFCICCNFMLEFRCPGFPALLCYSFIMHLHFYILINALLVGNGWISSVWMDDSQLYSDDNIGDKTYNIQESLHVMCSKIIWLVGLLLMNLCTYTNFICFLIAYFHFIPYLTALCSCTVLNVWSHQSP